MNCELVINKLQKRSPRVSIGMPVYNGEKYLHRAMVDILSQSFTDFELVVSDNCSTDSTYSLLKKYAENDGRIKIFRQDKNIGANRNFEFVLQQARGDYFMFAACDDGWDRKFIEELKTALDNNPDVGVAMSSFARVKEDGEVVDETLFSGKDSLNTISRFNTFLMMLPVYLRLKPIHVFIYGLYRTDFLKKIMTKSMPQCICSDRIIMTEVVLSTRLYSVADILHHRTVRSIPLKTRYMGESVSELYSHFFAYPRFFKMMLIRLMCSRNVPWYRKLFYVLPIWPLFVGRYTVVLAYGQGKSLFSRLKNYVW